ncbi:23S rRNA (uracil(747)-C(5))-methyltransferase RlmC [Thalassiella azotivora]
MQCDYFDAGRCRSCTLMGVPYATQVADKQRHCADVLSAVAPDVTWLEPFTGPESGFRNKAKCVVGGSRDEPTLGILDTGGRGVDLRGCGVVEPGLSAVWQALPPLLGRIGLVPYDVPRRSGELKYVHLTHSPDGDVMARFVLRSEGQLGRLRRHLPQLLAELPQLRVVTANLHPEHKATLEGEVEIPLTDQQTLPMRVDDVTLHLRPRSFFQTNTVVAAGLYRQVRQWVGDVGPASLWDLYSGVGGFALHALAGSARSGRGVAVTGVEVSPEAVASAEQSAAELVGGPGDGRLDARFVAADATRWALDQDDVPDLVVVNPPRRGIGPELADWLERSAVGHVVYSSCNPATLATDLARMPSLRPEAARLFDMFPQTGHQEVAVLLRRR